ncbi:MAG: response regulator transcription factor [Chloroflexi bacterium]|uniref:helix-turn-helix domain-containing protein n=1 Tax=Candidatus Flexifilum breve TaxID=3140694 RepID=UPI00313677D1|nr:response regulator transcription factor [Chloroflexota bacterium]
MRRSIGVVIVAAHDLTRSGLTALLRRAESWTHVAGVYRSLEEAEATFHRHESAVLLLEDALPTSETIFPVLHRLQRDYPQLLTIVLSSKLAARYLQHLFESGAVGFIYREDRLEEALLLGIGTVVMGSLYTSPQASGILVWSRLNRGDAELNAIDLEVLRLISQGLSIKQVAATMDYHQRSVYRIRQKLCAVLDAPTHEHLIDAARQKGFFE